MAHCKPLAFSPVPPVTGPERITRLVIKRNVGETVEIGADVSVRVQEVRGNKVRLTIEAPENVPIKRGELVERTQ